MKKFKVTASSKLRNGKKIMAASEGLSNPYIKIFLTNLGKYNEGELVGEWVTLPITDLESVKRKIGIDGSRYDEIFISDYSTNIPKLTISEYADIDELNELAEQIQNMDENQLIIMAAFLNHGASIEQAVEKCDDGMVYYDCYTDQDLGYAMADDVGGVESMDRETLEMYFDYESFGRSERINQSISEVEPGTQVALYW